MKYALYAWIALMVLATVGVILRFIYTVVQTVL
jgi:hypothetical protein